MDCKESYPSAITGTLSKPRIKVQKERTNTYISFMNRRNIVFMKQNRKIKQFKNNKVGTLKVHEKINSN